MSLILTEIILDQEYLVSTINKSEEKVAIWTTNLRTVIEANTY